MTDKTIMTGRVPALVAVIAASTTIAVSAATGATAPACTITGSSANDVLSGTSRRDVICGLGGHDRIVAGAGSDTVFGGAGDDIIRLGEGADSASGGAGHDVLYGGEGADVLAGGSGDDFLFSRDLNRDRLDGGSGWDRSRSDGLDRVRAISQRVTTFAAAATVVAAGDIAVCDEFDHFKTAAMLDAYPAATVATLGDNVYESGTGREFADCYAPSWGKAKSRTRPSIGNHEYSGSPGGQSYFQYFGKAAGPPGRGYYSYELAGWHVVVLNSNCAAVRGCDGDSPQLDWLRADLATHAARCTLAYWHHPRFSSLGAPSRATAAFWNLLHAHGAEVVLNGHNHVYERYATQTPAGVADPAGIRQFIIGTGGAPLHEFRTAFATREVGDSTSFGVLRFDLLGDGYRWQFIPAPGDRQRDSGASLCH